MYKFDFDLGNIKRTLEVLEEEAKLIEEMTEE